MNQDHKPRPGKPIAASVVSMIAGLWMLAMAGTMGWGHMGGQGGAGHMMHGGGQGDAGGYDWMWQHHRMMNSYGGEALWSWIGIATGIVVVIGAVVLYSRPASTRGWGVGILVASAVALLAGAGGFLAGVLGIVGGALAIAWRSSAT